MVLVLPIAQTVPNLDLISDVIPYDPSEEPGTPVEELIEFAGRNCYQSWSRPNPATATNAGYIKNIINQAHFSVLEHGSVTFLMEFSRAALAEITRHRHLSFSVLSQRFVEHREDDIEWPQSVRDLAYDDPELDTSLMILGDQIMGLYEDITEKMVAGGATRKQAREAARSVLPEATYTTAVVSGNFRAWRDFLSKRHHEAADAELQQIAELVLNDLRQIAPSVFADIEKGAL